LNKRPSWLKELTSGNHNDMVAAFLFHGKNGNHPTDNRVFHDSEHGSNKPYPYRDVSLYALAAYGR